MQGARKGEYAHTTPRTLETTQYEHKFEVVKIDEITGINSKRILREIEQVTIFLNIRIYG